MSSPEASPADLVGCVRLCTWVVLCGSTSGGVWPQPPPPTASEQQNELKSKRAAFRASKVGVVDQKNLRVGGPSKPF